MKRIYTIIVCMLLCFLISGCSTQSNTKNIEYHVEKSTSWFSFSDISADDIIVNEYKLEDQQWVSVCNTTIPYKSYDKFYFENHGEDTVITTRIDSKIEYYKILPEKDFESSFILANKKIEYKENTDLLAFGYVEIKDDTKLPRNSLKPLNFYNLDITQPFTGEFSECIGDIYIVTLTFK